MWKKYFQTTYPKYIATHSKYLILIAYIYILFKTTNNLFIKIGGRF